MNQFENKSHLRISELSVVTWDSSFRESLHWFDAMRQQSASIAVDFNWVDYYTLSDDVRRLAALDKRFKLHTLDRPGEDQWHLGHSVNAGVANSQHQWLLLTDGDIFVSADFLDQISKLDTHPNEVTYFRRYDQPADEQHAQCTTTKPSKPDLNTLRQICVLGNPTNFGACALLHRDMFDAVGGYEEHLAFAGPGIASMELNTRLRNAGAAIRWSTIPTYHPWHANTGLPNDEAEIERLFDLNRRFSWLLPYAGIEQSWITHCRNIELDFKASIDRCNDYLAALPEELQHG